MIRNANRNTAAFDRLFPAQSETPAQSVKAPARVFPLWLAVVVGVAALALPVAQIAGIL